MPLQTSAIDCPTLVWYPNLWKATIVSNLIHGAYLIVKNALTSYEHDLNEDSTVDLEPCDFLDWITYVQDYFDWYSMSDQMGVCLYFSSYLLSPYSCIFTFVPCIFCLYLFFHCISFAADSIQSNVIRSSELLLNVNL